MHLLISLAGSALIAVSVAAAAQPAPAPAPAPWLARAVTAYAYGCRVRSPDRTDGRPDVLRVSFETRGPVDGRGAFRVRAAGAALYANAFDADANQNALERVDAWNQSERRARLTLVETGPAPGLDLELAAGPELALACQSDTPYTTEAPGVAALIWHGMTAADPPHTCRIVCLEPAALAQ